MLDFGVYRWSVYSFSSKRRAARARGAGETHTPDSDTPSRPPRYKNFNRLATVERALRRRQTGHYRSNYILPSGHTTVLPDSVFNCLNTCRTIFFQAAGGIRYRRSHIPDRDRPSRHPRFEFQYVNTAERGRPVSRRILYQQPLRGKSIHGCTQDSQDSLLSGLVVADVKFPNAR